MLLVRIPFVIPAQAGIQEDYNGAQCIDHQWYKNTLDSRLRGNDELM